MQQALLIIDAQQELINGNQNQPGEVLKKQLIENVYTTIDKAVALVISIIFIVIWTLPIKKNPDFKFTQQ